MFPSLARGDTTPNLVTPRALFLTQTTPAAPPPVSSGPNACYRLFGPALPN
jgi:hypothetical protein